MVVYEYVDRRGNGVITAWYESLQAKQRAALDDKLEVLVAGVAPPGLLRGPVRHGNESYPNTYKLTINCGMALRPLACPGPFDLEHEWTVLVPVIEVGNRYDPRDFATCELRRDEVLADSSKRQIFRDATFYG
jgi:hypothetical protein